MELPWALEMFWNLPGQGAYLCYDDMLSGSHRLSLINYSFSLSLSDLSSENGDAMFPFKIINDHLNFLFRLMSLERLIPTIMQLLSLREYYKLEAVGCSWFENICVIFKINPYMILHTKSYMAIILLSLLTNTFNLR